MKHFIKVVAIIFASIVSTHAIALDPTYTALFSNEAIKGYDTCLLYTSPSPRDKRQSRMPSSA